MKFTKTKFKTLGLCFTVLILILGFVPLTTHAQTSLPTCIVINGVFSGLNQSGKCTEKNASGVTSTCTITKDGAQDITSSSCATAPDANGQQAVQVNNNNEGLTGTQANYTCTNGTNCTQTSAVSGAQAAAQGVVSSAASLIGDALVGTLANIAYWLMVAAGWLLGLVGIMFNWVVVLTVFQFGTYFGNTTGMLAAWGILRDIGNIALLFGFVSIGVMMILDVHSIDARKALPRLIIFAILLNFSLFISEAVVDVADVVAASIFSVSGVQNCNFSSGGGLSSNNGTNPCENVGIAGLVVQDTGAGSSFSPAKLPSGTNQGMALLAYIGGTIFILVVMVVLLAAAIMFFVRAVMLTLLLIVSPLGFAGMALPQFQSKAQQWQQMLISNAIFAPIFLLLVLIGLKVMEAVRTSFGAGSAGSNATLASALSSPSASIGGILISFALVIGFMVAALIYARSSGAAGAQFATSFAQKTVRGFVSLPARPIQIGARNVVGAGSAKVRSGYNSFMSNASNGRFGGVAGRIGAGALRLTGADESINATLAKGQKVKMGTNRTYEDSQKYQKGRTEELNKAAGIQKNRTDLMDLIKNNNAAGVNNDQIEQLSQKLKIDDFKEIFKQEKASIDALASVISTERFSEIMNDKDVGKDVKDRLKNQRFGKYDAWVAAGNKDELRNIKNDELALMYNIDPARFQQIAVDGQTADGDSLLSEDQKKYLIGNKSVGTNISKRIAQNNRKQRFGDAISAYSAAGVTPAQQAQIMAQINNYGTNLTKDEISSLKKPVLMDPKTASAFNAAKMAGIMAKNDLDPTEADAVLNNIHAYYMTSPGGLRDPKYIAMKTYLDGNNRAKAWWGGNGLP